MELLMDSLHPAAHRLYRRRALFGYCILSWHVVAAFIAGAAGLASHSIVLTSFGLVNLIQAGSAVLALWRLYLETRRQMTKQEQSLAHTLQFVAAVLFFLTALYLLNESGSAVFYRSRPEPSREGLLIALSSIIVLGGIAFARMMTARALGSVLLFFEAREDGYALFLPVLVFIFLLIHRFPGWWWSDALGALFLLPSVLREGWKAMQESKGQSRMPEETTRPA